MDREKLKAFLSSKYQGWQSFVNEIIFPIFGSDSYESSFETELLDAQPETRMLAEATGIDSVKEIGLMDIGIERLYIFDITVADKVMMDRNRVNIQRLIRQVMGAYSSAFMIFHYKDHTRWYWRFSFCHKRANNDDTTDRKRYTFLLGPGQSCKTATDNFMKLAEIHERQEIKIQDIEDAFSVEALSKEFFDKYKAIYEDIVEYVTGKRMVKVNNKWEEIETQEPCHEIMQEFVAFSNPEKAVRDYVKKLMGRLVFLQFLQKKGWLGVPADKEWGTGSPNFMQELYNKTEDKVNFIDEVLEALFNDLNTERANDIASSVIGENLRVPYLNGGLFERDTADETHFPLPSQFLDSLFFFFSCYNFTIDENDPNDAEMGVDPEMLGRIFENLLEDNKDKGAFYTPKEIVTYMCRESLIAYLQTDIEDEQQKEAIRELVTNHHVKEDLPENVDQRLKDVKICDPAIGSGAFPMGLLKELFLCRIALEGFDQSKAAEIKKHIIQQNIYGVDIERGAVDIARLRFWLSMIVDEQTPQALPNLDYKIVEGNSLITTFDGQIIDLSTNKVNLKRWSLVNIRPEKKALREEQKRFYTLNGDEKYLSEIAIKKHILNIIWYQLDYEKQSWQASTIEQADMFGTTTQKGRKKNDAEVVEFTQERQEVYDKCEKLLEQLDDESKTLRERASISIPFFDWEIVFSDVFDNDSFKGFDIVIGNPPYGASLSFAIKDIFKELYKDVHMRTPDTFNYFISQGTRLCNTKGILSYIIPNTLLSQNEYEKARMFLTEKHHLISVINIGDNIFEDADVPTCIIFEGIGPLDDYQIKYADYKEIDNSKIVWGDGLVDIPVSILKEIPGHVIGVSMGNGNLMNKIKASSIKIDDIAYEMAAGISTGCNRAFCLDKKQIDENYIEQDILKPLLIGRDIDKYVIEWNDKYIIYTTKQTDIKKYPNAQKFALPYKEKLDKRRETKKGMIPWWALNWPRYEELFIGEKIIMRQTSDSIQATYDTDNYYPLNSILTLRLKVGCGYSYKYILGILNSKLANWLYQNISQEKGRAFAEVKPINVRKLYVPKISDKKQNIIASIVDEILIAKNKNPFVDTSVMESKIDRIIYNLYDLSEDEIKIIEGTR